MFPNVSAKDGGKGAKGHGINSEDGDDHSVDFKQVEIGADLLAKVLENLTLTSLRNHKGDIDYSKEQGRCGQGGDDGTAIQKR